MGGGPHFELSRAGWAFRANWKRLTGSAEGGEQALVIGQHNLREDDVNWCELGWNWCEGKSEATSQRRCALSIGRHYRPAMSVRVAINAPERPTKPLVAAGADDVPLGNWQSLAARRSGGLLMTMRLAFY